MYVVLATAMTEDGEDAVALKASEETRNDANTTGDAMVEQEEEEEEVDEYEEVEEEEEEVEEEEVEVEEVEEQEKTSAGEAK